MFRCLIEKEEANRQQPQNSSNRQQPQNSSTMVLHNYKRVWTRLERANNYEYGMMFCAVHGFEEFKRQEIQSWSIAMMLFDDEERHLRRPENPRPLDNEDWARRRRLLHSLGNQLTRFLMRIKEEDRKIKNNVARANPIRLN